MFSEVLEIDTVHAGITVLSCFSLMSSDVTPEKKYPSPLTNNFSLTFVFYLNSTKFRSRTISFTLDIIFSSFCITVNLKH